MRPTPAQMSRMLAATALILGVPSLAHAHTGLGDTAGFLPGAIHPFTGLDHLLAILAVGLWAAQRGGRAVWLLPAAFLGAMTLGGALGMAGVALPGVEPGIAASVFVLGIAVAAAARLPLAASTLLVAAFAVLHGHAHGNEMPATASGAAYALGFLAATAVILATGVALATLLQCRQAPAAIRVAGGAIAVAGLSLCVMQF